jgi:NCAIR mutase (PurE)-related protein
MTEPGQPLVPPEAVFDTDRATRIGITEAILCEGKSVAQIAGILETAGRTLPRILLTRLGAETFAALPQELRVRIDFDPVSRTGFFGEARTPADPARIAVVSAGTSDVPVAKEAVRTLIHCGLASREIYDVGVAGLWRLLKRVDDIASLPVVIAVAGMDGAIFSVLGGLVSGALIAVPTSTGYGASRGGETALHAALASCAPGLLVVNIDNGYGAACAAARILQPRLAAKV